MLVGGIPLTASVKHKHDPNRIPQVEAVQSAEKTPKQRLKILTHLNMCSLPSYLHITQLTLVNMCVFAGGCVSVCFRKESSISRGKTGECTQESLYSFIMWVMLQ